MIQSLRAVDLLLTANQMGRILTRRQKLDIHYVQNNQNLVNNPKFYLNYGITFHYLLKLGWTTPQSLFTCDFFSNDLKKQPLDVLRNFIHGTSDIKWV